MGAIKRWDGGAWVDAVPKFYNAGWNEATVYKYDGSQWVEIYPGIAYNLDGESITQFQPSGTHTVGLRINNNGYIYDRKDAVYNFIDSTTDWVIPRSVAANDHWVRLTPEPLADSLTAGSDATGSWLLLNGSNTSREWYYTDSVSLQGSFTLEIATDSGGSNVVATGTYNLNLSLT